MTGFIIILFILGYTAIAFEHPVKVNKAASALLTGVACWIVVAIPGGNRSLVFNALSHHLAEIAGILFFLLGAMVIVELIDAHDGFEIITERIKSSSKKKLVWITGFITFILSTVLNNLTTAIVMVSLLRKLIPSHKDRLWFAGLVVIASNAGGVWTPIGDVTSTMLWIGGQVTPAKLILMTFLPSLLSFIVPAWLISRQMKGKTEPLVRAADKLTTTKLERKTVLLIGLICLLSVPFFTAVTHLPPYMGILFGLGLMWLLTEIIHRGKDEEEKGLFTVNHALRRIDAPTLLFFLGILLSVSALQESGILNKLAISLDRSVGNSSMIAVMTGLLSSVVDNVPLVAAMQGMYGLNEYPTDHSFWEFIAYCAGTGGSILVIGSAAGVAAMGMERIRFFWYMKNIAWLALLGFLAGAAVFLLQYYLIN